MLSGSTDVLYTKDPRFKDGWGKGSGVDGLSASGFFHLPFLGKTHTPPTPILLSLHISEAHITNK